MPASRWRVAGSVHGYAANTVAAQSPAAGTRVLDTGAPLITVTLHRNSAYPQSGSSEDVSPYRGTVLEPANLAAAVGPARPSPTAVPAVTKPKVVTPAAPAVTPAANDAEARREDDLAAEPPRRVHRARRPQGAARRDAAAARALALRTWLAAHPTRSNAAVSNWLYQNAWIVTGAKFGWWHGAESLRTLVAVDKRVQKLWGVGGDK